MTVFVAGNAFTQMMSGTEESVHAAYNSLSYKVKDWEMVRRRMMKFQPHMRTWDGTRSFFNRRDKRFLTGLLPRIEADFRSKGIPFEVQPASSVVYEKRWETDDIPSLHGISLRDYQKKAVLDFFKHKRGVTKLATGAGKTEVAIAIAAKAGVPTLFLTHRVNLLFQTAKRFATRLPAYKDKIGIIGAGEYSPNFITLATVQTLHSCMKKDMNVMRELMSQFKLVIIDEAHRSGSKSFYETASMCTNASLRLALTATPFMKGNEEEDMYLEGVAGNIVANVSAGQLIEAGVLAKPFFRFIPVNTPMTKKYTQWRDIYEFGIVKNVARNKLIISQTMKLVEMGRKSLVIVHEIKHGKILESVMKDMGIKVQFVAGQDSWIERDKALKALAKGKVDVIVCSNIFDEGVDVGEIGAIVLAAGCKSAPALFQRTGRAIRRKEEENNAIVIDFIDRMHPKLMEHSMLRYNMIKNEPGFTII